MPSKDTKIVSGRIPNNVEFEVSVSRVLTDVYGLIKSGVLKVEENHVVGVNPFEPSVDTVDYCVGCEYLENTLDMSKFNEVCEFKDLDKQKALDRCAQMLWR